MAEDKRPLPGACRCTGDGFAALPPELRPRPAKRSSLRQATCPGCGLVYWTNRETDLCMECEQRTGEASLDATEGGV
jgi:hypothetical protein